MWLLGIASFLVFGTIAMLCRRYLGQRIPDSNNHVNLVFYLFFLLPVALILWYALPHEIVPSVRVIGLLLATSAIWPVYYLLAYRASKDIDAGVYSIMLDTSAVVTAIVAYIFLTERLQLDQVTGILLLVFSGAIAIWPDLHRRSHSNRRGVAIGFLSVVLLGVGIVIDKLALTEAELGTYFLYSWGLQAVFMTLISWKYLKSFPSFLQNTPHKRLVYLHGGSGALRSFSLSMAILLGSSPSVVNASSNLLTVSVLIAAYIVLNERKHLYYKIAGAAIGLTGLALVAQ